jgi:fucose permease
MIMASVGIEFCCTAWSVDLLQQRTTLSPSAASAGLSAVVGGMAAGRFAIGRLAVRYSSRRLLLAAFGLTVVGWLVTWTATVPVPALVGLALLGLGIAGQYPLGAALALAAAADHADAASGRMALGLSLAAGITPFTLGALADATSTHTAFTAVPLLEALAAVALLAAVLRSRRLLRA